MEEKESKKYIKYTPDPVEQPFDPFSNVDKAISQFIVEVREEQDRLIMQEIQHIGGKRYEHITIDKNKTLDALDNAIPKKPLHTEGETAYLCPKCDHTVFVNISQMSISDCHAYGLTPEFCVRCGQKLDWSEEVEHD